MGSVSQVISSFCVYAIILSWRFFYFYSSISAAVAHNCFKTDDRLVCGCPVLPSFSCDSHEFEDQKWDPSNDILAIKTFDRTDNPVGKVRT